MNHYARSTRAHGQTYDNDRYGSAARGNEPSYDDGYDSYPEEDVSSSSGGESPTAHSDHSPSPPPSHNGHRHGEHHRTANSSRPRRQSMRDGHEDSEADEASHRGIRNAHQSRRHEGESEARMRRDRGEDGGARRGHETRGHEDMRRFESRPSRSGTFPKEDFRSDDEESEYEFRGPCRGSGMAASSGFGCEGGDGVDLGSRYEHRGPCDHVRGPRRTGERIDFDDDSEIDATYDVGYREQRRF